MISALLISGIAAQTCSGQANPTFTNCIRDALVNVDGQVGATEATAACASIQTDQPRYFDCLCRRYTSVVQCYTTFCSNDPSVSAFRNSQLQFCSAVEQIPSVSVPAASNTLPALPRPTGTSSAPAGSQTTTRSAAMNSYLSSALVFGEVIAMTLLTNIL
jgi:hypothetical protein